MRTPPGLLVVALGVGAVFAAPLVYLVVRSAGEGGDVLTLLGSSTTREPLRRTLTMSAAVAAAAAALGTSLAWLVTRTDLPLRRLWRVLLPLPLVIPSFVGAASLLAAFARGGLLDEIARPLGIDRLPRPYGFWGAFLVLTLLTYPYVYLPVAARLAALPASLEESARLLGRRPSAVFVSVVLPQAAGAVWAGGLLVFLYAVSDFGAVQLLRYDTLTRVIYAHRLDPPVALPLSLALGVLAVAVAAGERLVSRRRLPTEAARARPPLRAPLGRWKAPATVFVVGAVVLSLLAPLAVLGWWAVRGVADLGGATALAGDVGALLRPAVNTSVVSLVTAVVAVAVVLPVAYLTTWHRSRVADLPNAMVVGGFALPGLVIALALVFWSLQLPRWTGLYQSLPLLVAAYVMHFGAQSLRAAQVAVGGVPRRLDDAARMLGAGRARRFATVELPLMLPGLLAGAGLVLLSTMKELPATLLLAPTGFDTIAVKIWGAAEEGFLAEAGVASLLLVAVSGVLTWALVIRRGEGMA